MFDPFTERAKRHEERAKYWMDQGRPDFAQGSMLKAQRNRDAARRWDRALHGSYPKTAVAQVFEDFMSQKIKQVADEMAEEIFGKSSS